MPANIILVVERMVDQSSAEFFGAWTEPGQMAHHHVTVRDDDPSVRVTTDALFTEVNDSDVFVARQTFSGNPGIDPGTPAGAWGGVRQDKSAPSRALSRARMKGELTGLQA